MRDFMMFRKQSSLIMSVALGALLATACARTDRTYTDTAAGALDTAETIRIDDVTLGKGIGADKKVLNATDSFGPRDTIVASVKTTGNTANSRLTAKWMFEDSVTVEEQVQTITTAGDTYTEFHIVKPTAWPKGKYKVTVMLNGKEVETEAFTVK
jgi:hypothetical protein